LALALLHVFPVVKLDVRVEEFPGQIVKGPPEIKGWGLIWKRAL
jgi:hypothetical protein